METLNFFDQKRINKIVKAKKRHQQTAKLAALIGWGFISLGLLISTVSLARGEFGHAFFIFVICFVVAGDLYLK